MLRKQLITFGLSITALLAVLLLFGMTVSIAKADIGNTDDSVVDTDTHSGAPYQWEAQIGNGYSGTATTGYGSFESNTGGAFGISIIQYSDAGYTSSVGVCGFAINANNFSNGVHSNAMADQGGVGCVIDPANYLELIIGDHYYNFFGIYQTWNGSNDSLPSGWTVTVNPFSFVMPYFIIEGVDQGGVTPLTTKITSITPAPDQTIASSTNFTFGATGYISTQDWTEDSVLYIRYRQQTGFGIRGNGPIGANGEFSIPITSPEEFDLSTTTSVTNSGVYIGYVAIQKPKFSLFGFNFFTETLASNTWLFTVATSTARELESTVLLLSTTGGGNTIASTTLAIGSLEACQNFLSGSTTECLISIVVPSGEQLTGAASVMNTALSNNLPFSMFWQPYTQLKTISASTTPFAGTDVEVNMHNTFINGTTTLFSWADAKDTVDEAIPDSAVLYLVYAEWIIFGLYCIWRLTRQIS